MEVKISVSGLMRDESSVIFMKGNGYADGGWGGGCLTILCFALNLTNVGDNTVNSVIVLDSYIGA